MTGTYTLSLWKATQFWELTSCSFFGRHKRNWVVQVKYFYTYGVTVDGGDASQSDNPFSVGDDSDKASGSDDPFSSSDYSNGVSEILINYNCTA